jgi:hypothetical protein
MWSSESVAWTVHFSFRSRQRSQDDRMDWKVLVAVRWDSVCNIVGNLTLGATSPVPEATMNR